MHECCPQHLRLNLRCKSKSETRQKKTEEDGKQERVDMKRCEVDMNSASGLGTGVLACTGLFN